MKILWIFGGRGSPHNWTIWGGGEVFLCILGSILEVNVQNGDNMLGLLFKICLWVWLLFLICLEVNSRCWVQAYVARKIESTLSGRRLWPYRIVKCKIVCISFLVIKQEFMTSTVYRETDQVWGRFDQLWLGDVLTCFPKSCLLLAAKMHYSYKIDNEHYLAYNGCPSSPSYRRILQFGTTFYA